MTSTHIVLLVLAIYGVPMIATAIFWAHKLTVDFYAKRGDYSKDFSISADSIAGLAIFYGVMWPYSWYLSYTAQEHSLATLLCNANYRLNRWIDQRSDVRLYIVLMVAPVLCGGVVYGLEHKVWVGCVAFFLLMLIFFVRATYRWQWCTPRPN